MMACLLRPLRALQQPLLHVGHERVGEHRSGEQAKADERDGLRRAFLHRDSNAGLR